MVSRDVKMRFAIEPLTDLGVLAARVALAADRQGKFVDMHRALMSAAKIDYDGVVQAARRSGVNIVRLKSDMVRHASSIDATIGRNRLAAFGLGLAGTPSYLIGRYRVMGALSAR